MNTTIENNVLLLSEVSNNSCIRMMDKLFMFKDNKGGIYMFTDGTKVAKGDNARIEKFGNFKTTPIDKDVFLAELAKVDHQNDWYSLLLRDYIVEQINKL